jgi:tight adherence protein C
MDMQLWLAAAAVIAAVPVLLWSLHGLRPVDLPVQRPSRQVRRNLQLGRAPSTDMRDIVLSRPAGERVVRPLMEGMSSIARRLTPSSVLDSLERRRQLAGISPKWGIERILAVKFCLGAVGALCALLLIADNPTPMSVALGGCLAFCGFFGPDAYLGRKADARQDEITRELPDVLDQITICVEAGLGFEAAMARAARGGHGPLGEELRHTLQDIQVGVPRLGALDLLVTRTDSPDLRRFVVAVTQAERYGVPIAQILRVQATELREKRRFRAEERAQKLPVKLLFPLVFCILPVLFIVLVGPAAIRIANAGLGGS